MSDTNSKDQVVLHNCLKGSPADLAGMKPGDIILSVNGVAIKNLDDYVTATNDRSTQQKMDVLRNGKLIEVVLHLTPSSETPNYHAIAAELESSADDTN